jgi:hypothetical protein
MTSSLPSGYGPDDDLDRDGIPNLLDGTVAFLTQGSMAWHRSMQTLCQSAPFSAVNVARQFCLAIVERNWQQPLPQAEAAKVAAVLRLFSVDEQAARTAMFEALAEMHQAWPDPLDPQGSLLRSALRGIPDFAAIGIFNSNSRAMRPGVVRVMRGMLEVAIKTEQGTL